MLPNADPIDVNNRMGKKSFRLPIKIFFSLFFVLGNIKERTIPINKAIDGLPKQGNYKVIILLPYGAHAKQGKMSKTPDVENISQFLDSPASKSLTSDQESDIAIVKDQPSPEFAYSAKLASTFQSSREEVEFNFGRRVTIRKPSEGNKPDPNIYLEITGSDFVTQPNNSFSFPEALNSVEAARAVTEDGYFVSNVSGVVVNDVLKEGIVPIRDFDVVARKNILKILYLLNLESGEQDMTQFPSF